MLKTLLEVLIAPALVAVATLACGRWGARVGGLVSAFPAVVGPVLLIVAQQRGTLFAARAANGTLLGLVALSGFAVSYARAARVGRWPASLAVGWVCALVPASLVGWYIGDWAFPAGLIAAVISLGLAQRALPRCGDATIAGPLPALPRGDLLARMTLTAFLIVLLTVASTLLGPLVGGMLAALPVLASVLAAFTHRQHGPDAAIAMLRGMLAGMTSFVAFCAVVAVLGASAGTALSFAAATLSAIAAQALSLGRAQTGRWKGGHRAITP
jgi:hypothetical protein